MTDTGENSKSEKSLDQRILDLFKPRKKKKPKAKKSQDQMETRINELCDEIECDLKKKDARTAG